MSQKVWRTVEVTFGADEKPPSGIAWEIDKVEGEMAIRSIRPNTPAARHPELRKDQMLTHVDGINVEDVEEKGMTLKEVTKMIRTRMEGDSSVTIQLKEEVEEGGEPFEDYGPTTELLTGDDLRALSGRWLAQGEDEAGPGLDELIMLNVSAHGVITGVVDDGDGVMDGDDGDCKIANGTIDPRTRWIEFDQEYSDGAVTHWKCQYDVNSEQLVNGQWSNECTGTFVARRDNRPEEGDRLGYQVVLPKPVTVYAGASRQSDILGQLGPGSEAVTAAGNRTSMPYYDAVSRQHWVQLNLKHSVEDEDRGRSKGKVVQGWISLKAQNGREQLARAPNIDGSGVEATMLPSRRSPRKRSPHQTRRTPSAKSTPEPQLEPEPEPEPQPEPQLELLLPESAREPEPEPEQVREFPGDTAQLHAAVTPSEDATRSAFIPPSEHAIRAAFIPLGGQDIVLADEDKLLETFKVEMEALDAQCEMIVEALGKWMSTLKNQHENGCVDMTPFEEIVKNHYGICGIGDRVEDLRQAMEPHYGTTGAENLDSLSPSPGRAGSSFEERRTPAPALEPMESPALSNIKRPTSSSPSAFACCASPSSYGRKRSDASDETPTKTPNGSTGRTASKDKAETVACFFTFEETSALGIRFEEAHDKTLVVKGLISKGQAARFFRRRIKKGMRLTSVNGLVPIRGDSESAIQMITQETRPLTIGFDEEEEELSKQATPLRARLAELE